MTEDPSRTCGPAACLWRAPAPCYLGSAWMSAPRQMFQEMWVMCERPCACGDIPLTCVHYYLTEFPNMDKFLWNHTFSWFKLQRDFVFVCKVNIPLMQPDVSPHCLYHSKSGGSKREGSSLLSVGAASYDTNTPLALYSNDKFWDKKHSAGLYGLSSNGDSSPISVWLSVGYKWQQQLLCRYFDATKVAVLINLQSHTCKEIWSVRFVPALVRTRSVLRVQLISHWASPVNLYLNVCSHFQSGPHR